MTLSITLLSLALGLAPAQVQGWTPPNREMILVLDGVLVAQNVYWHQDQAVQHYALSHAGTYIVFKTGGKLYRVDAPESLKEAESLYAPLVPLAAEQKKLADEQKPLAARQTELAKQMAIAVDPEGVGKVGQQQGAVGQQQSKIGLEQSRVGRLQEAAWKVLQAAIDRIADACLANGTCPAVEK